MNNVLYTCKCAGTKRLLESFVSITKNLKNIYIPYIFSCKENFIDIRKNENLWNTKESSSLPTGHSRYAHMKLER